MALFVPHCQPCLDSPPYLELGGRKSRACWSPRALNSTLARAPTSLPGPAALHRVFHSLWVMLTIPDCKQRSTSDFFHHAQHPTTKPSRRPHEPSHLAASDFRVHIDFYPHYQDHSLPRLLSEPVAPVLNDVRDRPVQFVLNRHAPEPFPPNHPPPNPSRHLPSHFPS